LIDLTAQVSAAAPPGEREEVVLLGKQGDKAEISAGELADKAGTIAYEIVTAISRRVPREVI
jgi:alanine racemase